ncbi:MAG: 4'-phosphopantetheinyl transferase superfamily protein [Parabacteroides sp.]|nr:4'-phosphopantetheinyl transferase superfamily protein [Parabacteroides sp.]
MALLFKQTSPLLGIWKIEESSDELFSLLENRETYLSQLDSIHSESRRKEWLASRVLLQELLEEPVCVAYHSNGAPYLLESNLFLSISHTKDYVTVLLQEQPFVGIDIEFRSERVLKIRSRFMNIEEEKVINKENEAEHLLLYWCAKEALFKMIGQEAVDFQEHLHVCSFSYSTDGYIQVYETKTKERKTFTLKYWVQPDFVLVHSIGK